MSIKLHPHQRVAVDELANGKILRGDPGVGKSFTALAYFFEKECGGTLNDWGSIKTPKDLIIITTAKKRESGDWQRDCYKLGLMEDPTISVAGIRVIIDSWNQIEKYVDVKDAMVIFDEQRVGGSGKWAKTFVKITKNNRWILLSGTPGDSWLDYVSVFVANGYYKNISEFKREHVEYDPWVKFPKIKRYHKVGLLTRRRNEILVEMYYQRHTTRHLEAVVVAHDKETLDKVTRRRWNVFEQKPLRDAAELYSVSRRVVNSDPSRLEKIRELQKKHKRLIVFYTHNYELELLRTLGGPDTSRHTHPLKKEDTEWTKKSSSLSSEKAPHLTLVPKESTTNDLARISSPSLSTSSVAGRSRFATTVAPTPSGEPDQILAETSGRVRTKSKEIPSPGSEVTPSDAAWDYLLSPEGMAANGTAPLERVRAKFREIEDIDQSSTSSNPSKDGTESSMTDPSRPSGRTTRVRAKFREIDPTSSTTTKANPDAAAPSHHPESHSSSDDEVFDRPTSRKLYDRPSKSGSTVISPNLLRLLNGPGWSVIEPEEIQMMLDGSLPRIGSDYQSNARKTYGSNTKLSVVKEISTAPSLQPDSDTSNDISDEGNTYVTVAEWNGHKHQPVPTTDEWIYLVQYMAGAEAWNCTETDAMAFYSLTYSYKQLEQAQGRIDRINTPFDHLWYYLLYSESWIDKAIKKALDLKQDFNEARARAKIGPMQDAA